MDNQLSAIVLHDVKNALGELEGRLEALTHNPDQQEAMHAHRTCVALRERLIGFLTLYKASTLGLHANVEAVPTEDFLKALVKSHAAAKRTPPLSLATVPLPELGFFDEHLVGLALEAALQNAMRFARSAIEIGCATEEGELIFFVKDDGPGLDTAEQKPSTGLGMELCKAIAEAHRKDGRCGSVSVCNHPGGGALFELRLP